jgi:hypothetical protein
MQRFRFPIAVALTSLGLVTLLVVGGGLLVGSVLARGPLGGDFGPWSRAGGGHWGGGRWAGLTLPPELAGLHEIPAAERFAHFKGAQISLTDRDGQPLVLTVTPGVATSASATSVTINATDGETRTFGVDAQTAIPARRSQDGSSPSIAQGDKVVVVTINGSNTAAVVWSDSFSGWGRGGPFGHWAGRAPTN